MILTKNKNFFFTVRREYFLAVRGRQDKQVHYVASSEKWEHD